MYNILFTYHKEDYMTFIDYLLERLSKDNTLYKNIIYLLNENEKSIHDNNNNEKDNSFTLPYIGKQSNNKKQYLSPQNVQIVKNVIIKYLKKFQDQIDKIKPQCDNKTINIPMINDNNMIDINLNFAFELNNEKKENLYFFSKIIQDENGNFIKEILTPEELADTLVRMILDYISNVSQIRIETLDFSKNQTSIAYSMTIFVNNISRYLHPSIQKEFKDTNANVYLKFDIRSNNLNTVTKNKTDRLLIKKQNQKQQNFSNDNFESSRLYAISSHPAKEKRL